MRKLETILTAALFCVALAGCGDINVSQPGRPIVVEEHKTPPVIVEKTVDKPVIIEKTNNDKPNVIIEKH